jgi:glycosyltransferase involved in cell wall biosynthesis
MARLAWFSPMPPARSGIAACCAVLVPALRRLHEIDVFVDEPPAGGSAGLRSAHEFPWRHQRAPYDVTVYQLGNSACHDFLWPYLFRYPGLVVLHDIRLHHARAAALLRRHRAAAYRDEFVWNHPGVDRDLAELAVAGFDSTLYYDWPMTRLILESARAVAVHTRANAATLKAEVPSARIDAIHLGHGDVLEPEAKQVARTRIRTRLAIPPDAILFGCFGGLTPQKRIAQVLGAFSATLTYAPGARLLLAGDASDLPDVRAEIRRLGLSGRVSLTGYLESDSLLTDYIAACDASLNLRWPTAGEVSGPWLRCLALGLPTVVVDLAHMADVPSLDPRTWHPHGGHSESTPVCIAIDILDEDHSLALAMRRLATQPAFRKRLGDAAAAYWQRHHTPSAMIENYEQLIDEVRQLPTPEPRLPRHLRDDGGGVLDRITAQFGLQPLLR